MSSLPITEDQKPKLLTALYNAAKPLGMGFLHYDPTPMTITEAEQILAEANERQRGHVYFDYLKGRVMKLDFSGDTLNFRLYDRDNGEGRGEWVARAALLGDS